MPPAGALRPNHMLTGVHPLGPGRVCKETGEQLFTPETVTHVPELVSGKAQPKRTIETPVFDYAA